jgi:hypothetical protein
MRPFCCFCYCFFMFIQSLVIYVVPVVLTLSSRTGSRVESWLSRVNKVSTTKAPDIVEGHDQALVD